MQKRTNCISVILSLTALVSFQGVIVKSAAANDLNQIKSQCRNITPQQRQLAKTAGYDIDSLCRSANNISIANTPATQVQTVVPRGTPVSNDRGVLSSRKSTNNYTTKKLKKYGYDLFSGSPTTFAPVTNIPIPVDYIVGPGDNFTIELLGKVSQSLQLSVNRNGSILFPELGPISVTGLKFTEAKSLIESKIAEQMIGVRGVISLGELRSIRVFVLGEAFKPGSYTVSSLSTITNAIFASGGISDIGSLRNIHLKRQGEVIGKLDLYDLLQKGDTSSDVRLLPGDVIFIPPVGKTVSITGQVKRPAIYELKDKNSLAGLIDLAGGYSSNAFPNISHIIRKNERGFTSIIDVDLSQKSALKTKLKRGDNVNVGSNLKTLENVVTLKGAFRRNRTVAWKSNLKLSDLIRSASDLNNDIDLNIGLIIRKEMPLKQISVLHFDLKGLIEGKAEADIPLQPMDEIRTFSWYSGQTEQTFEKELADFQKEQQRIKKLEQVEVIEEGAVSIDVGESEGITQELEEKLKSNNKRTSAVYDLVKKLQEQTATGGLVKIVDISGNVRFPGTYPLTQNMTVRDLVILAGGLKEASYLDHAEVTRRNLTGGQNARIEHFNVRLSTELTGQTANELMPKDKLAIYSTPEYRDQLSIQIDGEVKFPGLYEFSRGETLSQVIARAGGFTPMAHIEAAVFSRRDLKVQEAKRLEELRKRMREDIAASELENAEAGEGGNIQDAEQLLSALSETEALGRLVISLEDIVINRSVDISLKDGDRLVIPGLRQEVSVIGEVQHSTSHLFNEEWTLEDYIEKSGGMTQRADDDRIYVVRADGSVFLPNQSNWLSHQNELLSAGDTIVVPLDTDRIKSLSLWTSVSQIIYQLALGAAAFNNLSN